MSHPTRTPSKHDRRAFIACTAIAIAIIVAVWVWTVQITVVQGVEGARQMLSTVVETAGDVREEAEPNAEVISAVKAGFQGMIDEKASEQAEAEERQETVNAVAELMKNDIETYGQEPEPTNE